VNGERVSTLGAGRALIGLLDGPGTRTAAGPEDTVRCACSAAWHGSVDEVRSARGIERKEVVDQESYR
jgi:hypothetical protein